MKKPAKVDTILQRLEDLVDEIEDEQTFNSARNDSEAYTDNVKQELLLKNAHIMVCNAFEEQSKFNEKY